MKKTILITGGSQRIGRSIALFLKDSNYNFIIHYNKSSKAARELKNIINGHGRDCEIVKTDLSKISDVKNIIKISKKFFGPINAIVNNASLFINDNIENLNDKLWYDHMNINLYAPLIISKEFNKQLPKKSLGHIINILDQNVVNPDTSFFSYSISKSALLSATTIMAKSFAPNIRVNAIGPGPTLKNIHQSKKHFDQSIKNTLLKIGSPPEEIAKTVKFLLESKSITGQFIAVDGGEHLS
jgi:NAD(P)-dependent dehydrogenase (short-subunit alcohol dehydrogenase family)